MNPCIVVKKNQFNHQLLYTGRGDEGRCHFCQQAVPSRKEYEERVAMVREWARTRFPEGAEL
jgi:hypothetical protein